ARVVADRGTPPLPLQVAGLDRPQPVLARDRPVHLERQVEQLLDGRLGGGELRGVARAEQEARGQGAVARMAPAWSRKFACVWPSPAWPKLSPVSPCRSPIRGTAATNSARRSSGTTMSSERVAPCNAPSSDETP